MPTKHPFQEIGDPVVGPDGKPFYWTQRRRCRLAGFDYSSPGAYLITICTHRRRRVLSWVEGSSVCLTDIGALVLREWKRAVRLRPDVKLDVFIIMPDHLHGVVWLVGADSGNNVMRRPTSIPGLIQQFKSMTTRLINRGRRTPGARLWQRSYHDRVIRSEEALLRIRAYIQSNPMKWELDRRS